MSIHTMRSALLKDQSGERDQLAVSGVSVSIGKISIVRDVSFQARAGEMLAVIGPSGSGKTTLVKSITGERPYAGSIQLGGKEVSSLSAQAQALVRGVLPQASVLSFPLTVSEVIGLGILERGFSRSFRQRRIAEALKKVGLEGFEGRTYQDLSGGEQQRVQLGRVLCQVWEPICEDGTPKWLILDEPVSSLDIKHQYQIMELAKHYARQGGGVLAVMHDLNLTAAFADRILVMKNGQTISQGAVQDVFESQLLSDVYGIGLEVEAALNRSRRVFCTGRPTGN